MGYKKFFFFALALVMATGLSGCKKDSSDTAPLEYSFGGMIFPALSAVLEEEEGWSFTDLTPEEASEDGEDSEDSAPPAERHYLYENLSSGPEAAETYLTTLTANHIFFVVDSSGAITDFPDFSLDSGSALMSKFNLETQSLVHLFLSWTADSCSVELSQPDVMPASVPGSPSAQAANATPDDSVALTAHEAVAFLYTLSPSALELAGDSMSEYNIYMTDGLGWIDGVACVRMRVYRADPKGFNAYMGSYLLTGDMRQLYRVNPDTNEAYALLLS